jgi:general secretion pathway protein I
MDTAQHSLPGGPMRAATRPGSFSEEGFTLLEVLVATMVLGIAVVVVLQLFSGGLDQARRAADYTRAVLHARAVMEEVLLDPPAAAVLERGDFGDGYRWAWEVVPDREIPAEDLGVQPVVIRVTIGWGFDQRPKEYHLQTMALAPNPVESPS